MKKYILVALTAFFALSANAQSDCCGKGGDCCFSPYWYIQAQGGVQLPYTPGNRGDLLSPVIGLNIGRQVNPLVGVRLGAEGWESKVKDQYATDTYNKFKYYTVSFDATLNLVNLFTKKACSGFNFYLLGGVGYSWSEATLTSSTWFAPAVRAGAIIEARLSKNFSLSLEHRMTNTSTQWNGRIDGDKQHDWYSSTLLGIAYNFGHKKVAKPAPTPEPAPVVEEPAPEPAPAPAPVVEKKPEPVVVKDEPLKETFFYLIRESDPDPETILNKIADWCKKYPAKKITVSGYADKGTGNATINAKYAQQRAEKVAKSLQKKGIAADRMTVNSYGDTVQPFAENDRNRCVIVVGE